MTQEEAIKKMLGGANIFLTGEPGAGKTYTLNKFIEQARAQGKRIAITASTGIAASHIDGQTIHSWSGLGIKGEGLTKDQLRTIANNHFNRKRYRGADILIIDEVSMLHGYMLDQVNTIAQMARGDKRPFGGMQVILVGDLFQLPPVSREGDITFVHQSEAWSSLNLEICYLTEQHRQGADGKLLNILRAMRNGTLNDSFIEALDSRVGLTADEHITRLYTHNVDVDQLNHERLAQLPGEIKAYRMRWEGDSYKVAAIKRSVLAPEELRLKINAEVMFVANSGTYVNGTRGKVIRFNKNDEPVVETTDGRQITVQRHSWKAYDDWGQSVVAEVWQMPLRLAWAVTIHKSQGMSLDEAEIDLSKAFVPGMGYVALSRVRSLEGLYLVGLNDQALTLDEDIAKFDKLLKEC